MAAEYGYIGAKNIDDDDLVQLYRDAWLSRVSWIMMVEELDKEFEDKMAALVKEKQEKREEIAEKVKVKQERQAQVDQETLAKLEKEHKAEREELMEEMWGQAEEGEKDNKQPVPNHHDQPHLLLLLPPLAAQFALG